MQMLTQVMSVMPNEQQDVPPEPEMSDRKKGKMPEREFAVQESSVDNNHTTASSSISSSSHDNNDSNSSHVERE